MGRDGGGRLRQLVQEVEAFLRLDALFPSQRYREYMANLPAVYVIRCLQNHTFF